MSGDSLTLTVGAVGIDEAMRALAEMQARIQGLTQAGPGGAGAPIALPPLPPGGPAGADPGGAGAAAPAAAAAEAAQEGLNASLEAGVALFDKYKFYVAGAAAGLAALWAAARQGAVLNQMGKSVQKFGLELDAMREATVNMVDDQTLAQVGVAMARQGMTATQITRNLSAALIIATEQGEDFSRVVDAIGGAFRGESDQLQNLGVQLREGKTVQDDFRAAQEAVNDVLATGSMRAGEGVAFYDQWANAVMRAGGEALKFLDNLIRFQQHSTASSDLERGRDQVQAYGKEILDLTVKIQTLEASQENVRRNVAASGRSFEEYTAEVQLLKAEMVGLVEAQAAVQRGIDAITKAADDAAEARRKSAADKMQADARAGFDDMLADLRAYGNDRAEATVAYNREVAAIEKQAMDSGMNAQAAHQEALKLARRKYGMALADIARQEAEELARIEAEKRSVVADIASAERAALPEAEQIMADIAVKIAEFRERVANAGFSEEQESWLVVRMKDALMAQGVARLDAMKQEQADEQAKQAESAQAKRAAFDEEMAQVLAHGNEMKLLQIRQASEMLDFERSAQEAGLAQDATFLQARAALEMQQAQAVLDLQKKLAEDAARNTPDFDKALGLSQLATSLTDQLMSMEIPMQAFTQTWTQFWADLASGASAGDIITNMGKILGGMLQQIGTTMFTLGVTLLSLAPFAGALAAAGIPFGIAGAVAGPALIAGGLGLMAAGAAIGGALGSAGGGKSASGGAGGSAPGLGGNVGFRPPEREKPTTIIIQVDGRGSLDTSDSIAEKVMLAIRRGNELGMRMA